MPDHGPSQTPLRFRMEAARCSALRPTMPMAVRYRQRERATQELLRLEQKQWRNGSFHRSKHELVFVFKVDSAAHTNTFGLGDTGRYRTNVWDYAGVNSLRVGRAGKHP
jgi:hypothetical protein